MAPKLAPKGRRTKTGNPLPYFPAANDRPMTRYTALDRLHARVVRVRWLQYFTAFTRVLLAISFLPSGITKVLNHRFTSLPISEPVGFFFEAFYRSGVWYQFVGWAQLTAAVLLLL